MSSIIDENETINNNNIIINTEETTVTTTATEEEQSPTLKTFNAQLRDIALRRIQEDAELLEVAQKAGLDVDFHGIRAKIALHYDMQPLPTKRKVNIFNFYEEEKAFVKLQNRNIKDANKKAKVDPKVILEKYINLSVDERKALEDRVEEENRRRKTLEKSKEVGTWETLYKHSQQFQSFAKAQGADYVGFLKNPVSNRLLSLKCGELMSRVNTLSLKKRIVSEMRGEEFVNKEVVNELPKKRKARNPASIVHAGTTENNERVGATRANILAMLNYKLGTDHANIPWSQCITEEEMRGKSRDYSKDKIYVVSGWEYGNLDPRTPFKKAHLKNLKAAIAGNTIRFIHRSRFEVEHPVEAEDEESAEEEEDDEEEQQ